MLEEDLDIFFNEDEHATQFVIQKSGEIFSGILDKDYVDTGDISGFAPVITCASSDLTGLARNDLIEHGGTIYRFILEEPDGTGVSRAILEVHSAQG